MLKWIESMSRKLSERISPFAQPRALPFPAPLPGADPTFFPEKILILSAVCTGADFEE